MNKSDEMKRRLAQIDADEMRNHEVWDQLPDESGKAYQAFLLYRNLPPSERTLLAAWKLYNPPKSRQPPSSHFNGWSKDHKWVERSMAWDRHFLKLKDKASEKVFEKEMLEARQKRQDILNAFHAIVAQYFMWVNDTEKNATKLRAIGSAASTYMDQSRKEYGDDPMSERQREEELKENMENVRQKIASVMANHPPMPKDKDDKTDYVQ